MSASVSDYDYELPADLIAQRPLARRDASRMMVLRRDAQSIEHRQFSELPTFIAPGDLLVLNDTRVVPARRFSDDGTIEFLFTERLAKNRWRSLVKPGRKMRIGDSTTISGVRGEVESLFADGTRAIVFDHDIDLHRGGVLPLPPYIDRAAESDDADRYQTIFAKESGSVAAPTAGLHFTSELLAKLPHAFLTLHVGTGTFRPVQVENIDEHPMHAERFSVSDDFVQRVNCAERVIAVGTTSVRVLETIAAKPGRIEARCGATDIFIRPPFQFRVVDALLTNFHLPRSTLLMLVSAFAGPQLVLRAYQEAINERYRFYSYGDCMLIL